MFAFSFLLMKEYGSDPVLWMIFARGYGRTMNDGRRFDTDQLLDGSADCSVFASPVAEEPKGLQREGEQKDREMAR